jgi:isoleucyl-tRNA synthetase
MYANIDEFNANKAHIPVPDRPEIDRWIISRLNTTIKQVEQYFDEYEPTRTAREMETFVEELSNWYVRRNRRRFWKSGATLDKTAAYQTLHQCLLSMSQLMSPIAPFLSEWMYQRLTNDLVGFEESVHLSFFPTVEETAIIPALEHKMERARLISAIVLRIRNQIDLNVRQPLARIILPIKDEVERDAILSVQHIILEEVNVKEIQFVDDDSGIVHKTAKPNYPLLGKKLGPNMKAVAGQVQSFSTEQISDFERLGQVTVRLDDGAQIVLVEKEIDIIRTGLEGWQVESEAGLSVAVDTELSVELQKEGLAREFVNRVQNMRKEANFDVTDRIATGVQANENLAAAISYMAEYIQQETLSESLEQEELQVSDYVKTWEIGDEECIISIRRT